MQRRASRESVFFASRKIFENDKSTKQVKFEEPTLKLEEEEPLILEEIHDEKTQATNEKQVSPAARKIANEAKVDLNKIQGPG